MTGPVRLDLHVHSDRSPDSELPLDAIAARIRTLGLNGFAVTDHNAVVPPAVLADLARRYPELTIVPGVEVSTADGHLLGYGIGAAPPPHRPCGETVAWVIARGGVAVPAHPFRWTHGIGRHGLAESDTGAIEAANGQSRSAANVRAAAWAAEHRLGSTGGSDAHTLAAVGRAWTEFASPPASVPELVAAIGNGRTRGAGASVGSVGALRWAGRNAWRRLRRGFRAV